MDNLSNKQLRLIIEIITEHYKKYQNCKPNCLYIQFQIYEMTGMKIPLKRIKNIKPFKKIIKKKVIAGVNTHGQVKTKEILRFRNKNRIST